MHALLVLTSVVFVLPSVVFAYNARLLESSAAMALAILSVCNHSDAFKSTRLSWFCSHEALQRVDRAYAHVLVIVYTTCAVRHAITEPTVVATAAAALCTAAVCFQVARKVAGCTRAGMHALFHVVGGAGYLCCACC